MKMANCSNERSEHVNFNTWKIIRDDESKAKHIFLTMKITVQMKTYLPCGSKLTKRLCYTVMDSGS
jgi:hypothetical protein